MTSRILVADDSLTIQKVIGITLANSDYEIIECLNENDLFKKIESNHFDLILLDFNLSDTRSGYELSKQINNVMPGAAIIVMLGTFDSIDEGQFASSGISDKIVKPFESSKFIKKCKDLLEGITPRQIISEEVSEEVDLDQWKVDAPKIEDHGKEDDFSELSSHDSNLDPLSSEIEGWGFAPTPTLEEKFNKVFPAAIEVFDEHSVLERLQSSSTFIEEIDEEEDKDETDPTFNLPIEMTANLQSEIDEELSADSFWAVDEVAKVESEEIEDIKTSNLDEITTDLTETLSEFQKTNSAATSVVEDESEQVTVANTVIHMDQDQLVEKLTISLRPMIAEMVKEAVKEYCKHNVEKVAWEVIPDLAENLIRNEIKEIADSVNH